MNYVSIFKKITLLLIFNIILISCGGGGGETSTTPTTTPPTGNSPGTTPTNYQGSYSGTFTDNVGSTIGTWTITIDANNKVIGSAIVTATNEVISLSGNITINGNSILSGAAGVITYTIVIDANGKVTGTWADSTNGTSGSVSGSLTGMGTPGTVSYGSVNIDSTDIGMKVFTPDTVDSNSATAFLFDNPENASSPLTGDVLGMIISFDTVGTFTSATLLFSQLEVKDVNYCYQIICNGLTPDAQCKNIAVDGVLKTINFSKAVIPSSSDAACSTTGNAALPSGTTSFDGKLNW